MKVLILNYEYPPIGGGGAKATEILAEALAKRGHEISVLTTHFRGEKYFEVKNGVKVYRIPVIGRDKQFTASMISMLTWPILSIPVGLFLCIKYKFDLINTHFFSPTGPTGLVLTLLTRIPNAIYAHGADVYDPTKVNLTPCGRGIFASVLRFSLRLQAKFAVKVCSQSSDMLGKINKLIFTPDRKKTSNIPLPFVPSHVTNEQKPEVSEGFKLVSLGRVISRKGFADVITAMPNLPNDVTYTIMGDGPELANLKNLTEKLKVANRVFFLGAVTNVEEKNRVMTSSNCFVLPSRYEPFGLVIQEAMHCGLPIIATNLGGPVDLIKNEVNGLLVSPQKPEELAEAVSTLYSDRTLCSKIGIANKEEVKKYFVENLIPRYEDLFFSCIDRKA